jgi:hypothetical protein
MAADERYNTTSPSVYVRSASAAKSRPGIVIQAFSRAFSHPDSADETASRHPLPHAPLCRRP